MSVPEKVQDVNDLMQDLIDVWPAWATVEHSFIDISMPAFKPEEDILNIHGDTN